jgi:ABC-type nitrate/sulfonate/bicarbonate transport system substrate-binding protein
MTKDDSARRGIGRRAALGVALAATAGLSRPAIAQGAAKVRIGVPTRAYWPTIVALATVRQKLFEKEGATAEMTIYRSGAECFEALAAGAADIILDPPALVAAGIRRGVGSKLVAGAQDAYFGWHLMVRQDSPVQNVAELAGKKVGITAAGSGSDLLARWTMQDRKVDFTRTPVGGGGLVPNLRSRNLDAAVIYSPLSFQLMRANQARSLIDFTAAMPRHCVAGWIVPDKMIAEKPALVQASVNALYGGLAWLRANRDGAVALIAENNEIPTEVAAIEHEETILKLLTDGRLTLEEIRVALALSELGGMTNLAPAEETFDTRFKPVPTAA